MLIHQVRHLLYPDAVDPATSTEPDAASAAASAVAPPAVPAVPILPPALAALPAPFHRVGAAMDQASAMLQAMYPGRVAPNFLPMLPRWDWLAQQLGTKPVEPKPLAGPHEIRLEKRRRRKRDRMLYNFWIPLLLGTPPATAATNGGWVM